MSPTQKERLLGRKLPTTWVSVRVEFTADADLADRALADAQQVLVVALAGGDPERITRARDTVEQAQRRYDPYAEKLEVRALPPAEYEELLAAHPPDNDTGRFSPTFIPALLALCVVSELDEADWLLLSGKGDQFASGEIVTLFSTCLAVNDRSPGVHVSKG